MPACPRGNPAVASMNIAERGLLELYLVECLDEISKVLILQSGPPPLAIVFGNHAKRILGLRVRPKLKALTLDLTHIIKCAAWDSVEDVGCANGTRPMAR